MGCRLASRTDTYGEEEAARLRDRPDRQSMGADRTPHSRGRTGRASPQGQQPRVGQRHPLFPPSRDGLAAPSPRSPALADGLLLSAALAARGGVGSGSPHARDGRPRAGRARGEPDGCDPGQPIRSHGGSKRGSKGYDAGKKIKGRKRHVLTDTDGRLLAIEVHGAERQTHILVEVGKRSPEQRGFAVTRRGGGVERPFAGIVKNRRFVRDY